MKLGPINLVILHINHLDKSRKLTEKIDTKVIEQVSKNEKAEVEVYTMKEEETNRNLTKM